MIYSTNYHYSVGTTTMALERAFHMEYETIIHDTRGTYYTKQTVNSLLDDSCMRGGSTAQGRLHAAKQALTIRNKIPLIIDPYSYLVAFPTHSPKHEQNIWFFPSHIIGYHPHPHHPKKLVVTLTYNRSITVHCSQATFRNQQLLTSHLVCQFSLFPRMREGATSELK
ncbi:competence protein ComK [Jeotgalibacillus soli]|uniref:Competence protein n=1 Tax=Jeotgalibacillus soli TaxID=889306 RepID=A0A0C2RI37_9BACL|nr:competence protein ComK [Jeotgalibacillus soli]KIL49830.1 hypothetical protein KP78_12980 [Jeotgalibacillus soli]